MAVVNHFIEGNCIEIYKIIGLTFIFKGELNQLIFVAINITVNDEKIQTADLNPEFPVGTNEVVESIVRNVQNLAA